MAEIKFPIDYQRLPEFRMLATRLSGVLAPAGGRWAEFADVFADHIFARLWVDLGYAAQAGARLGVMSRDAAQLYTASIHLPEVVDLMGLLVEARLLAAHEEGYQCDRFAKLNPHLAADFVPREKKGGYRSGLSKQLPRIDREAAQQLQMLGGGFRDRAGQPLSPTEEHQVIKMIRVLDNILQEDRVRRTSEYGEGIVADAADAVRRYKDEAVLRPFYFWLLDHRGQPGLPSTAEQVLTDFDALMKRALG